MYARKIEWSEGDLGSSECPRCRATVRTRYERRTVRMGRTRLDVPEVLVQVCSSCDHTVSIPRQSFEQLREVGAGK